MPQILVLSALAALSGVSVVLQQALNANLRTRLGSAAWSGFTSYLVGVLCMLLLAVAVRDPLPSALAVVRVPWWAWSGGLFGAIFIALAIMLVPRLGAASFVALLVGGQMLASLALDHFGWLGLARRSVDPARAAGATLLIAGVILIRR